MIGVDDRLKYRQTKNVNLDVALSSMELVCALTTDCRHVDARTAHLYHTNAHASSVSGELVHIFKIHLYQFHLMPHRLACSSARCGCASLLFYLFSVMRSSRNGCSRTMIARGGPIVRSVVECGAGFSLKSFAAIHVIATSRPPSILQGESMSPR